MAHFGKCTRGASGHMTAHYERKKIDGEHIKYGNQDIDLGLSHLNYNLAPQREQMNFIKQRLSEVKVQKRSDVNVLCSWVVTLPQGDYSQKEQEEFFKESYKFLVEKYGEKNTVSAYVHLDENQPHMHFAFIPVVQDKKHPEREKVSAKECVTRGDLKTFHKAFQEYIDQRIPDAYFPVLNGATAGGNKTVSEMKAEFVAEIHENEVACYQALTEQYQQDADSVLDSVREAEQRVEALQGDITSLEGQKTALRGEIEQMQGEASVLQKRISEATVTAQGVKNEVERLAREHPQGWSSYNSKIAEMQKMNAKDKRLSLLEKFVEIPAIKPIFDRFCRELSKNKEKGQNKNPFQR